MKIREPEPEPEGAAPIPPNDLKWKLRICCIVIYILWVVNIALTTLNVYVYYDEMQKDWNCERCFYRSYMLVAVGVASLSLPILVVAIPLVIFRMADGIRIYVTILFLATWLKMMMGLVLKQDYQPIGDVINMWVKDKSLTFFEVKYKCCGVLGPEDYLIFEEEPPNSCYKDRSGKTEDLFTTGCSTLSVKNDAIPYILLFSLLGQFSMVLALVIYMIILKRTKTPRRTWMRPAVQIEREPRA